MPGLVPGVVEACNASILWSCDDLWADFKSTDFFIYSHMMAPFHMYFLTRSFPATLLWVYFYETLETADRTLMNTYMGSPTFNEAFFFAQPGTPPETFLDSLLLDPLCGSLGAILGLALVYYYNIPSTYQSKEHGKWGALARVILLFFIIVAPIMQIHRKFNNANLGYAFYFLISNFGILFAWWLTSGPSSKGTSEDRKRHGIQYFAYMLAHNVPLIVVYLFGDNPDAWSQEDIRDIQAIRARKGIPTIFLNACCVGALLVFFHLHSNYVVGKKMLGTDEKSKEAEKKRKELKDN